MFVMDMIDTPQDSPPVIVVSQAEQSQDVAEAPERTIGVCYVVGKRAEENLHRQSGLYPWSDISVYFSFMEKNQINHPYGTEGHHDEVSVSILKQPEHGTLVLNEEKRDPYNDRFYYYKAEKDFHGMDKAIILGEVNGHKVELHYYIHVVETRTFNQDEICGENGILWRVSQYIDNLMPGMEGIAPWLNVKFDNLDNSSLGEATSEGYNASITLGTDANGFGWFVDLTPGLNDEFLTTANPYEWKAKPGSEAEGKIDLLTVLLHEAAHTLGYDHTNDSHALMAPTLEPGIRRLPSDELLAELQGLSNTDVAAAATNPDDPSPIPNPIPSPDLNQPGADRNFL